MKMALSKKSLSFLPRLESDFSILSENDSNTVMSPVTELTLNLEQSSMSTPRRKLSLNLMSPTPSRSVSITESIESGVEVSNPSIDSCFSYESPTFEFLRRRKNSNGKLSSSHDMRRLMARRSFSSPALPRAALDPLKFSPTDSSPLKAMPTLDLSLNHDDEKHSDLSLCEMNDFFPSDHSNDDFTLKKRHCKFRSSSAPVGDDTDFRSIEFDDKRDDTGNNDDGFFDCISFDDSTVYSSSAPTDIKGLIDGPLKIQSKSISPINKCDTNLDKENIPPTKNLRNDDHLFVKPKALKNRSLSLSMKRDNPGTGHSPSPASRKKRTKYNRSQSVYEIDPFQPTWDARPTPTRSLHRSQSFDTKQTQSPGIAITSLFDIGDKKLIGDDSKEYCLPLTKSKHPDLKAITPATLTQVLDNSFDETISEYFVIDCRYPYEFEGGHIRGALNIYERNEIIQQFLKKPRCANGKRQILIFHCEFSSKRGPDMCRFLRNKDRDIHKHCYPTLYYPEMYLLEGGYKEFYAQHADYCEPRKYREMVDPHFEDQLKHFAKRSKSWSEDKSLRRHKTGLRY